MGQGETDSGSRLSAAPMSVDEAARALDAHATEWVEPLRMAAAGAVTSVSLAAVVREALTSLAATLQADAASVLIASDDGEALIARTSVGLTVEVDLAVRVPRGEGYAGRILASAKPLVVEDLEHFEVRSPVLRESALKSIAGVPLLIGDRVVGVLHVASKKRRSFSEEDIALLERVAYPVAAAVERVRLFDNERTLRRAAELTAARLAALQEITAGLAGARNVVEVCRTILEHALGGQGEEGGEAGIWMLREGKLLRVVGGERASAFPEIPLDDSMPARLSLETGRPHFVETRQELIERWPDLAATATSAFAGFALTVGERRLGVMAIGYQHDHHFDSDERAYLMAVAEQASLALDRAQAAEAERAAAERQAFLAETSLALTNRHASPGQLLETLAHMAVPRLADVCAVVAEQADRLEVVAIGNGGAALPPGAEGSPQEAEVQDAKGMLREVLRSGQPLLLGGADQPALDPAEYGSFAEALGLTSLMLVPFASHNRTVGVMCFAACGQHANYTADDLALAEELAWRAGRLVEDLTQRARERALAETLTRALLPARLPHLPGLQLAARYLPAEAGPVGGDWYDAFELPDGRLAVVVGDVGGHGVEAASAMGRLRNGLFAFASEGHDPTSSLERLSDLLGNSSQDWNIPDPIASVSFGALDRATLHFEVTCAGHPPWLLLRAGRAEFQQCGGRVLAANLPAIAHASRLALAEGDVCIFMTDGLVERPHEDMDDSLERLRAAAERHAEEPIEALADALVAETTPPGGRTDDCCLLVVRIEAAQAPS